MHDLPFFPKPVLSFSISLVYYLDYHNLPRSKKPCLCLICQVLLSHSSATLRQFCWQHFPCFIPLPSIFQLRVSLHTKPNPTAEQGWTCQKDEARQHRVTGHSILFHSILLQGLGASLATLTSTYNVEKEKPQTPLFFCFSGRLKSSACFLPWRIINHQEMMHSFDTSPGSHADRYRQEQQASPEHMCKYSRIANTKDKHSWAKQLC